MGFYRKFFTHIYDLIMLVFFVIPSNFEHFAKAMYFNASTMSKILGTVSHFNGLALYNYRYAVGCCGAESHA